MSKVTVDQALSARATPKSGKKASHAFFKIGAAIAAVVIIAAVSFAFIISPRMKAEARDTKREEAEAKRAVAGASQPADVIRTAASSYDRIPVADAAVQSRLAGATGKTEAAAEAHSSNAGAQAASRRDGPSEAETARASGLFFADNDRAPRALPPRQTARPPVAFTEDYADVTLDRATLRPLSPNMLQAGTIIPAALETAVDTNLAGAITARVTQNVFDTVTGEILLIPQGARLIGRYDREVAYGQQRAFLVWQRILFANGQSITLGAMPGTDATGATGVADEVDYHSFRLGRAIALAGAVTTIGELARDQQRDKDRSLIGSAGDAAAIEAAQVAGRLIDREMKVNPTIRIRAGAAVNVVLTRDVILTPYREAGQ
jgi:type IV secretion system protein VirB10